LMSFLLPAANVLLRRMGIDLHDGGLYARLMDWVFTAWPPELLALPLLGCTVGLYYWMRPRERDVFWDLVTLGPAEQLSQARQAAQDGENERALQILSEILEMHENYHPAWLLAGEIHYRQEDFDKALESYERGLGLGTGKPGHYTRAALAASRTGDNGRAYAILKQGLEALDGTDDVPGTLWYNLACYGTRLGKLDEALVNLRAAVRAGYKNVKRVREDKDLEPLRSRPEFRKLVAQLQ